MAQGGNSRSRLLLVILLVTSLFLITLDLRGVGVTSASRGVAQTVISPIQKGVSNLFSPIGRFLSDIKNFGKAKAQIKELQSANAKLKSELTVKTDVQGALKQLQDNLDLAGRGNYKVAPARVIGRGSASTFSQTITIDKGESSGIRRNMTVISENGLVGVIKTTTSSSAVVLLMSDPTFRVGVRVGRNQSNGVLIGGGGSLYTVELLDPAGSIQIGDSLVTLGSGNNRPFIPGLPVGVVTRVDHTTSTLTQRATVKAYSNLGNLGVVSVVLSAPSVAPTKPLAPTPRATITVLVTPTPTPSESVAPTASSTSSLKPKVKK